MGKASSAKKVARAASVGESRRVGERRLIGFPAAVVLTMVAGIALVAFAAGNRDAPATPTLQDHWHDAYGIYDCQIDGFEAPLAGLTDAQGGTFDPDGIHSHEDGLIHIHPFTSNVTGDDATMAVFFETVGLVVTDTTLTTPGRTYDEETITCDGEPVEIQILRWTSAASAADSEPDEIITENLADVQYDADGEAFTIAIAPLGADIPPPPTITRLLTVNPTLLAPGQEIPGGGTTGGVDAGHDADLGDAELVPLGDDADDADTSDDATVTADDADSSDDATVTADDAEADE